MRFSLAGSSLSPGLRAHRARFPTCGVIRVAGYSVVWDCDPTPHIFPKEHQKERCGHSRSQRSFITFLWCASEYSVAGRISCHVPYDSARTNVCQWLFAENYLLPMSLLNRIDSTPIDICVIKGISSIVIIRKTVEIQLTDMLLPPKTLCV